MKKFDDNLYDILNEEVDKILKEKNIFKFIFSLWFYIDKVVYFNSIYLDRLNLFRKNNFLFLKFYKSFLLTEENIKFFNELLNANKIFIDPQNFFYSYLNYKKYLIPKVLKWLKYLILEEKDLDLSDEEKLFLEEVWKQFLLSNIKINLDKKKKYWSKLLINNWKVNADLLYPLANFVSYIFWFSIKTKKIDLFKKILQLNNFRFSKDNIVFRLDYLKLFEFEKKIDLKSWIEFLDKLWLKYLIDKSVLKYDDLVKFFEVRSLLSSLDRKFLNVFVKYFYLKEILYITFLEQVNKLDVRNFRLLRNYLDIFFLRNNLLSLEKFIVKGIYMPSFFKYLYIYLLNKIFKNYFYSNKNGEIAWNRFKFILLLYFSRNENEFNFIKRIISLDKINFIEYVKIMVSLILILFWNLWLVVVGVVILFIDKFKSLKIDSIVKIENLKISVAGLGILVLLASLWVFRNLQADISKYNKQIEIFSWRKKIDSSNSSWYFQKTFSLNIDKVIVNLNWKILSWNIKKWKYHFVSDSRRLKNVYYISNSLFLWNIVEKVVSNYEINWKIRFENEIEKYKFIRKVIKNYVNLHIDDLRNNTYLLHPEKYKWNILVRYLRYWTPIYVDDIKKIIDSYLVN